MAYDALARCRCCDSRQRGSALVALGLTGRGKRGGVRVIYYWVVDRDRLLMLLVYPKNVQDDLSPAQLQALRRVVETEYP